ncbi:hypothetical protein MUK42_14582 [Musa troglodytarum]|uniref:Uncharacterized protein n=1 Tax=Musa troglodytarum TaxID=320322 RepID=A0A9E7IBN0_9LILI|nr:hypothetical protein MUK42_14582 [Musa troglodytarum]URE48796.1 hypothetical protein MUK42_14582 [Musa troglodytarum]
MKLAKHENEELINYERSCVNAAERAERKAQLINEVPYFPTENMRKRGKKRRGSKGKTGRDEELQEFDVPEKMMTSNKQLASTNKSLQQLEDDTTSGEHCTSYLMVGKDGQAFKNLLDDNGKIKL